MMFSRLKYQYTFALLLPFWAMLLSVIKFKSPSAKNLFWYGCAFMGIVFIFFPVGGSGNDSTRIAQGLIQMHYNPVDLKTILEYFYSEDYNLDIYQTLVTFMVSLLTKEPHFLFFVFALVFGYFYSRNLFLILELSDTDKLKWWVWIVLIMFILILPIWLINGVRMWTAMHVFLYGVFSYFLKSDKKMLLWCFLSLFIHFSFIIPLSIFLVYLFLPKRLYHLYFMFYFVSILFAEIDVQFLKESISDLLPRQLSQKTGQYMNEDYVLNIADRDSSLSQYIHISHLLTRVFVNLMILFFWMNLKTFLQDNNFKKLILPFLLFAAVFEFLSVVPSMGRFVNLSNMLFYALCLIVMFKFQSEIKYHKYLTLLLILPILFSVRVGFDFYGISLFVGNFVSSFFIDDNLPLIEYVKSFL